MLSPLLGRAGDTAVARAPALPRLTVQWRRLNGPQAVIIRVQGWVDPRGAADPAWGSGEDLLEAKMSELKPGGCG